MVKIGEPVDNNSMIADDSLLSLFPSAAATDTQFSSVIAHGSVQSRLWQALAFLVRVKTNGQGRYCFVSPRSVTSS